MSAFPTFVEKGIPGVWGGGGGETPNDHFRISSKLYFAHGTPLVTDFARIQPRLLKLPNILDSDDKC